MRKYLAIALFAIASTVAAVVYVQQERYFYWSDFTYYQTAAWFARMSVVDNGVLSFPLLAWLSTGRTHNLLFTVPLVPIMGLLGDGRAVYIGSLVALYLVPYVLTLAAIVSSCVSDSQLKQRAFWICAGVAVLTPAVWAPSLRGYPDALPALLVAVAVWLYVNDMEMKHWRRAILIGVLLGLAPVIRRHYFYADFAFGLAALATHLFYFRRLSLNFVLMGVSAVLFLLTFGLPFLQSILAQNYIRLYEAAYAPYAEAAGYFFVAYGGLAWALAGAGFVAANRLGVVEARRWNFVLGFAVLSILAWIFFGRHLAVHYTLYSDAFVVIGLTALILAALAGVKAALPRAAILATCALVMVANLFFGLLPPSQLSAANLHPTRPGMLSTPDEHGDALSRLFSASYAPLQRADTDEILRLVKLLRPLDGPVLVASFSKAMAPDIIKNAQREIYGIKQDKIILVEPPFLDSRDSYWLDELLWANFAVVAEPVQTIYRPENELLLHTLVAAFRENWTIAQDFELMPDVFHMQDGSMVRVYKRIRPTSVTVAIQTLEKLKSKLNRTPLGQPDWISSDGATTSDAQKREFTIHGNREHHPGLKHFLLSAQPLPKGTEIEAKLDMHCPSGGRVLLGIYNQDGIGLGVQSSDAEDPLTLHYVMNQPGYAVLGAEADEVCVFELRFLTAIKNASK
jgi:hypothetical protein